MLDIPRGMKDFDGIELSKIEHIREKFIEISSVYGFSFMEPSPLEMLSVLETKSGPAIRDEIYHFTDKGSREVALRFDFTVGLTRYIASQKSIRLPAKVSGFGGVFRYDEPQRGRYRYFHQWDVEVYGKPGIETDAEIIELTSRLFDSLGLTNIVIHASHRRIVESYIRAIFESDDATIVNDMLRAVDKIQKKSRDDIICEFTEKGYDKQRLGRVLDFSQIRGTISEVESSFDVSLLKHWDEMRCLFDSLENRGVTNVQINFGIVRGLDYYSGIVFEVFAEDSSLGALAGGGRYDSLTGAFGRPDIGAAGVAGGVERMILTMDEQDMWPSHAGDTVSIVYVNPQMQKIAARVASGLRRHKIKTRMDLLGRPLRKQMDAASESAYAVIIAPREAATGMAILHNMEDGQEVRIKIETLVDNPAAVFQ